MRTDASLQTKQSSDRNLPCLSPRELIAELIGEIVAPDILASAWPTTLLQIIHMPEEDMSHVLSISLESARKLAAAFELHRRLVNWSLPIRPIIKTPEDAMAVLAPMCSYDHERFWCLALDVRCRLIASPIEVSRGDVDGTDAGPRSFFRAALRMGATSVIAAHNHPSGDISPSPADMAVTRRLVAAGRTIDVTLADHLIISADRRWLSMRCEIPDCFR